MAGGGELVSRHARLHVEPTPSVRLEQRAVGRRSKAVKPSCRHPGGSLSPARGPAGAAGRPGEAARPARRAGAARRHAERGALDGVKKAFTAPRRNEEDGRAGAKSTIPVACVVLSCEHS
jgi:hypothetical protein